jgi:hypothetical protein
MFDIRAAWSIVKVTDDQESIMPLGQNDNLITLENNSDEPIDVYTQIGGNFKWQSFRRSIAPGEQVEIKAKEMSGANQDLLHDPFLYIKSVAVNPFPSNPPKKTMSTGNGSIETHYHITPDEIMTHDDYLSHQPSQTP